MVSLYRLHSSRLEGYEFDSHYELGNFHQDLILDLLCRLRTARLQIRDAIINGRELWPLVEMSTVSEKDGITVSQPVTPTI